MREAWSAWRERWPARGEESGFTLVELLVSIILLSVVSATFVAATNSIYSSVRREQGEINAADGNRSALRLLDKQVRYASAINSPAIASDGNFYIEYKWSKSNGSTDTVTCSQWRLNPVSDVLQLRSWTSGTVPSTTPAWTTVSTGVTNAPATDPPLSLAPTTQNGVTMQYQQVKVNLRSQRDTGTNNTVTTLTALNTASAAVPTPPVCQEVGRP